MKKDIDLSVVSKELLLECMDTPIEVMELKIKTALENLAEADREYRKNCEAGDGVMKCSPYVDEIENCEKHLRGLREIYEYKKMKKNSINY